jgi:flagellar protein FlaI
VETRPCFASSWVGPANEPRSGYALRRQIAGVDVTVSSPDGASFGMYEVDPPEYRLSAPHLQALTEAIPRISSALPDDIDISSLDTIRPYIKARAKDLIFSRLVARSADEIGGMDLDKEADRLAELLCKYTAGYGVLETLLEDGLVQDIYVDAPSSQTPVHVVLRSDVDKSVRQKCRTNILVGRRDLQSFVSRVKFETGRPFSEAHPVLEADIRRLGARVTLVGPPLSDRGVSIAIRKHSESLWTMSRLIANDSLSPLLSAFLWACVLGRRTVLLAGSRGAGKTTLLGAMLLEFPLSQRMILIEDTPEISVRRMQTLGYDIQALRFSGEDRDGMTNAQEALRVSLRMGESAIVIGEVRGQEAKVLYESMRAGSAGSSVLGTIHGNSAKGVLDRAVEDLGISERAFSSTDIVVVIGLVRSPDGTRFSRRVVEVAEIREDDHGLALIDLFRTDDRCPLAKPTPSFSPRCRSIQRTANSLGVDPEDMMVIIKSKAHADQVLSESKNRMPHAKDMTSDAFRVRSNEILVRSLFAREGPESGLSEWRSWLDAQS